MTALALEIQKKANRLSAVERERLAERLLAPLESDKLTAVDEAWVEVAERRFSAWMRGRSKAGSASLALADIRKNLKR